MYDIKCLEIFRAEGYDTLRKDFEAMESLQERNQSLEPSTHLRSWCLLEGLADHPILASAISTQCSSAARASVRDRHRNIPTPKPSTWVARLLPTCISSRRNGPRLHHPLMFRYQRLCASQIVSHGKASSSVNPRPQGIASCCADCEIQLTT